MGIPSVANVYRVSVRVSTVTILTQLVEDVTVVPVVTSSSLTFIAADEPRAFETEGDPYIMQLSPGHPLNSLDAGAQVVIDQFITSHSPLKNEIKLVDAPFWTDSQRAFLQDIIIEDSDWAVPFDQLNEALRRPRK